MSERTRYQAAIVRDHHVLHLKVHDIFSGKVFWLIPGGGRHAGESEEACVVREVLEETNVAVEVLRLLVDEPAGAGGRRDGTDRAHRGSAGTSRCRGHTNRSRRPGTGGRESSGW